MISSHSLSSVLFFASLARKRFQSSIRSPAELEGRICWIWRAVLDGEGGCVVWVVVAVADHACALIMATYGPQSHSCI